MQLTSASSASTGESGEYRSDVSVQLASASGDDEYVPTELQLLGETELRLEEQLQELLASWGAPAARLSTTQTDAVDAVVTQLEGLRGRQQRAGWGQTLTPALTLTLPLALTPTLALTLTLALILTLTLTLVPTLTLTLTFHPSQVAAAPRHAQCARGRPPRRLPPLLRHTAAAVAAVAMRVRAGAVHAQSQPHAHLRCAPCARRTP